MPRPLNLVMGEGRYKGIGSTPLPYYQNVETFQNNAWVEGPYDINVLGYPKLNTTPGNDLNQPSATLDYMNAVDWFTANPSGNLASMGVPSNTVGSWVQKNMGMILIGGIVGLFLARK